MAWAIGAPPCGVQQSPCAAAERLELIMKPLRTVVLSTAIIAWLYYFLQQKLPLSADETYFAHIFWLLKQGYRQYVDFYSTHLPFYFEAIRSFLPSGGGSLGFIWPLRAISVLVMIAYAARC